jgi:FkbM family methyltransferase
MGTTAEVSFEGVSSTFTIVNHLDHIQAHHGRGSFYELRQLLFHRDLIPQGATVLDVGANVGNHTVFYANHTPASKIYCFEPNIKARQILEQNVLINPPARGKVKLNYAHFGIGQVATKLQIIKGPLNNLGATHLAHPSENASLAEYETVDVIRLDSVHYEGKVSFIKIDVEGMEVGALIGAEKLIDKNRPSIAIEVTEQNEPEFWKWVSANDYHIIMMFNDYMSVKNYLMIPQSRR